MNLGIESETVEFKKSTGELKEGIISISSMLNKNDSAVLYFGVLNNGDVIGQDVNEQTLRRISREIAEKIIPKITPTITLLNSGNRSYIKVEVEGKDKPYSAYGRYYIRSFDEDRNLEQHQLFEMLIDYSNKDLITIIRSDEQKLTFKALKNLYIDKKIIINEDEFENNLGLYTPNGEYNYMAYLLSDNNELSIKVVTFAGEDKTVMVRRNEYGNKCLMLAVDQVLNYIEAINDTKVTINTHSRVDETLFDMSSFKEAWMNACLHSRWDRRVPPIVYIYSNRIEIVSSGGLPYNLSEERFYKGTSRPVNEKLQKILGQLRYVEQTGHGIPIIVNKYGKEAFDIENDFITVTIPFSRPLLNKINIKEPITLNKSQEKLINYLKENNKATVYDISSHLKVSEIYVKKMIAELKKYGFVERIGSNKKGYWIVLK